MPFEPSPEPKVLDDPRSMRALAHPVRIALMELLTLRGPMTATQCAERVGESPSSCSFHLRTLAKYGFIEEDPDAERSGRQRPWRAVAIGNRWSTAADTPPALRHAGEALARVVRERDRAALDAYLARQDEFEPDWAEATVHSNYGGFLTAAELRAVGEEIHRLWQPYLRRITHPDERPDGSRLAHMFVHGFPRADSLADDLPTAPRDSTTDHSTTGDGTTHQNGADRA
jgi:DNA-binding transcriptional ArsR family regulator